MIPLHDTPHGFTHHMDKSRSSCSKIIFRETVLKYFLYGRMPYSVIKLQIGNFQLYLAPIHRNESWFVEKARSCFYLKFFP